jgi:hypothetical protein
MTAAKFLPPGLAWVIPLRVEETVTAGQFASVECAGQIAGQQNGSKNGRKWSG